jgi:hypothetical protein
VIVVESEIWLGDAVEELPPLELSAQIGEVARHLNPYVALEHFSNQVRLYERKEEREDVIERHLHSSKMLDCIVRAWSSPGRAIGVAKMVQLVRRPSIVCHRVVIVLSPSSRH